MNTEHPYNFVRQGVKNREKTYQTMNYEDLVQAHVNEHLLLSSKINGEPISSNYAEQ